MKQQFFFHPSMKLAHYTFQTRLYTDTTNLITTKSVPKMRLQVINMTLKNPNCIVILQVLSRVM